MGISPVRTKVIAYVICGIMAAIAGIIFCSRIGFVTTTSGNGYEMKAVAACVLGGISFAGGDGKLWGGFVGVLIIGVLTNALTLMNVGSYWQDIVKGVILVLALYIDRKQRELNV